MDDELSHISECRLCPLLVTRVTPKRKQETFDRLFAVDIELFVQNWCD